MKCKLHDFEITTCGSESYAGQNPTQQSSTLFITLVKPHKSVSAYTVRQNHVQGALYQIGVNLKSSPRRNTHRRNT